MWDHHAYLLLGNRQKWVNQLRSDLPGVEWIPQIIENFGINESRQIRQWQQVGGRYFMLSFQTITPEAQNALLKTLEEPAAGNRLFLITESLVNLLPTLLSRLQILTLNTLTINQPVEIWTKKFLASDYESRLQQITDLLQTETETGNAKSRVLSVVNALEKRFHAECLKIPTLANSPAALESLVTARSYLHDQAALPKLILEHLALTLPLI